MSVQRRDRHLTQLHSPLFVYLLLHRVSVQRRDRLTVIIFPCDFLRSHSVSVQRRDRSLFFLLHFFTKVPLFTCFVLVQLCIFVPVQDFFCAHTVCLSKDVTGRCSFHCIASPRPPFYLIISIFLVTFVSLQDFFSLYFHSVSVQRRGRYSVIHFDLAGSL